MSTYSDLPAALGAIVGADHLCTDNAELAFHAADLGWSVPRAPLAMIAPASTGEVAAAVRLVTAAGHACVARGGGMSYTGGAVPEQAGMVIVDMRRLQRIVEINGEDMYVTVETGCTWKTLYLALRARGLRMPFFGPLSGQYATIGGALAQNGVFMGSGAHGSAADNCLGLEVVLADGSVLLTGSGAGVAGNGFLRHAGPDLTGIFTSDAGAFGIKTRATFKLIRTPAIGASLSFAFNTVAALLAAQTELARRRVTAECFGFNPHYNTAFKDKSLTLRESLAALRAVLWAGDSPFQGLKNAAAIALRGKTVLADVRYSLHINIDADNAQAAAAAVAEVNSVCLGQGYGLPNSLPLAFRAQPFRGVRNLMLGPRGEVWIPLHGLFPLSKALDAARETEDFFAEHAALMERHGIVSSYLTFCNGNSFVIEPSLYWHDALGPFRLSLIEPEFRRQWEHLPPRPEARAVALSLRAALRDRYDAMGCFHLQLGKYYPYQDSICNEPALQLINDIKQVLDPRRRMNPGALGLR